MKGSRSTLLMFTLTASYLAGAGGCGKPSADIDTPGMTAVVAADDSAAIAQVTSLLSLEVATRVPHLGMLDSVYITDTGDSNAASSEIYDHVRWLADGRVLGVDSASDSTRMVKAVITTVADVVEGDTEDRDGVATSTFRATLKTQEDTVYFLVVRGSYSRNKWMVLGSPRLGPEGNGFGFNTGLKNVRWAPVGASPERARSIVDSIRQARGLPLVK